MHVYGTVYLWPAASSYAACQNIQLVKYIQLRYNITISWAEMHIKLVSEHIL